MSHEAGVTSSNHPSCVDMLKKKKVDVNYKKVNEETRWNISHNSTKTTIIKTGAHEKISRLKFSP
jgi:fructose-1-phosphate kinase PfkB-like protein